MDAPLRLALAVGSQLDIGNEHGIHDVHGFVRLKNHDKPSRGRRRHKIRMMNWDLSAVGQVHDKRAERLRMKQLSYFLDRHCEIKYHCSAPKASPLKLRPTAEFWEAYDAKKRKEDGK